MRHALSLIAITGLVACGEPVSTTNGAASGAQRIYCGRLIDGIGDDARSGVTISIVDSRISAVSAGGSADDADIDLSAYTCLPGLIDTHTHVVEAASDSYDLSIYYTRSLDDEQVLATANAATTLGAGFTTVRNVGSYNGWAGRVLRDRINSGEIPGPAHAGGRLLPDHSGWRWRPCNTRS